MIIADMHTYFKILVNKLDSTGYLNLEPEEIDVFLNESMFRMIEQRAYGNNPKNESLEETQKRTDDLKNLISSTSVTTFTTNSSNKANGRFAALPADYRHAIEEDCTITYLDCNDVTRTKVIPIKPITHDRYNRTIRDPFNKPFEDLVIRLAHGKVSGSEVFELITDGVITVTSYNLRYLKTPTSMRYGTAYSTPTTDVDCELSEHLHREIVELAAKAAIETIESPRVATYPQIQRETE